MLGQGWTISAIARELHLDRKTVRRYARTEVEGLLSSGVRRASLTIIDRCDEIATTAGLAPEFAMLLRQLRGAELAAWTQRAQASGIREISSFAATLHRDWDAVVAGLTLPYSNGPTEGKVNRLKLSKRAMYGRARFDLLQLRVLATS
ncbi:transposase [Nocardia sp. NPDC051929]|uniref:transposase n=1 Tax=Nocardia sp. NPDC051929 TaxID=3364327 RepID=UPI0037C892B2